MSKSDQYKNIAYARNEASLDRIKISFEYVDWDIDYFFVHGMDAQFYRKLVTCLNTLTKYTEDDLRFQRVRELSPKFINWDHGYITQKSFPARIDEEISENAFEIQITKNSGRVHGFIYNNVFHIVWFDPCHNLFPGKTDNKENKVLLPKDYIKGRPFSPEAFNDLLSEREALKVEISTLTNLLEERTAPDSF